MEVQCLPCTITCPRRMPGKSDNAGQLDFPYRVKLVSIFEGEGQTEEYRQINPWGAVPAIQFDDGRVLSESNAILFYLAEQTDLLPGDRFHRAKVLQWLSFEGDYVQSTVGSLRYWALTGKLEARSQDVIEGRRQVAERALSVLDDHLKSRTSLSDSTYSWRILDLPYGAHAEGRWSRSIPIQTFALDRPGRSQPKHLEERFPYTVDPHATQELP